MAREKRILTEAQYQALQRLISSPRAKAALKRNQKDNLDWTSDPCRRCGKYPLSIFNKHGYCRKCARNHASRIIYPNKGH